LTSYFKEKLAQHAYPTITALESDVKRMVANAKHYNDKRSAVYEDSERLRKTASNFFTKHNPAYRDPTYVAVATPIPGESNETAAATRPTRLSEMSASSPAKTSEPAQPAQEDVDEAQQNGESEDFKGKTFQQAQDQIVEELIHYVDEEYVLKVIEWLGVLTIAEADLKYSAPLTICLLAPSPTITKLSDILNL
jgi:hypothetical protein